MESALLAAYMPPSPGFALLDAEPTSEMEPFGLLEALRQRVRDEARAGERYLIEVETGLPPGASPQAMPRDGFDPALTTLLDRARAKAAELGVSLRTVQAHRARYSSQGVWGLVDQRAARMSAVTGRVGARLVAAVRAVVVAETDTSTGPGRG